ncbi:jg23818 [Pararge aegeria aegeria]|uniref:Jg23818 protein n=1 Tax=Pararge aegeria aegeria TaxID=348720 RepID=A0A8S4SL91_9NEOP|nr:jg23818 [Pararge aegeria aegeria]
MIGDSRDGHSALERASPTSTDEGRPRPRPPRGNRVTQGNCELFSRRAASLTLYCVATFNKCHDNVPPSVYFDVIKVDMRRVLLFLP